MEAFLVEEHGIGVILGKNVPGKLTRKKSGVYATIVPAAYTICDSDELVSADPPIFTALVSFLLVWNVEVCRL